MPEGYAIQAIQAVLSGQRAYCKFLAANDTGLTGGHQAGIYISKPSIPILFDEPGIKGTNKEKWVKVKWQDGIETDTRFIYYGKGTRNEYRITNFGRGFPFLRPEYDVHPVKETMKKHKIFCDRQHSCRSFFMQREKGHVSQKE